jgi:membrane-bound serine protease (ClpP class)
LFAPHAISALLATEPSVHQRALLAIANPDIALSLLVFGMLGVYAEFIAPGRIAPGVVGASLVALGLKGFATFPFSLAGTCLIVLAFACFLLDACYPTRGLVTFLGAIAMIFGVLDLRVHPLIALALTIPFAFISAFLFSIAVRARRNKTVMPQGDSRRAAAMQLR